MEVKNKKREITPLKELPLSHVFMFAEVMRHADVCKLFLEALLQTKISKIEYINKEQDISDTYAFHGIRLDVYVETEEGSRYNIEMQRTDQTGLERRIRYYQSGIDRAFLESGADYEDLPESYVIFICDYDCYGRGLACYERVSVFKDCEDLVYEDGSHAILLNSHYTTPNASHDILEFLDYIRTNNDQMPVTGALTEKAMKYVRTVRSDPKKEAAYMNMRMALRDERKEGFKKGIEEGIEQGEVMGETNATLKNIKGLMRTLNLSAVQALQAMMVPEAEQDKYLKLLSEE